MNYDKSPQWNLYGEDEDDDEKLVQPPIPKNRDFFSSFLADRLNQEEKKKQDEDEDDDEEEDSIFSSKKKKRRSNSASLFSKIITPSESAEDKAPSAQDIISQAAAETGAIIEDESPQSKNSQGEEASSRAVPEAAFLENEQLAEVPIDESHTSVAEQAINNSQVEEIDNANVVETEQENETTKIQESAMDQMAATVERPSDETSAINPKEGTVNRRTEANPDSIANDSSNATRPVENMPVDRVVEREVIDRKPTGAVLAFLGAEFLSRRRDRKIKAEMRANKKEAEQHLQELQEEQMTQKEAQATLYTHQQQEIQKLRQDQKMTTIEDQSSTQAEPNKIISENNVTERTAQVTEVPAPAIEAPPVSEVSEPIIAATIEAPIRSAVEVPPDYVPEVNAPVLVDKKEEQSKQSVSQAFEKQPIAVEPVSIEKIIADKMEKQKGSIESRLESPTAAIAETKVEQPSIAESRPERRRNYQKIANDHLTLPYTQAGTTEHYPSQDLQATLPPIQEGQQARPELQPSPVSKPYKKPIQIGVISATIFFVIVLILYLLR